MPQSACSVLDTGKGRAILAKREADGHFSATFKETPGMDENTILDQLEELIEKFGVQIRHEAIRQDEDSIHVTGGLCLLRGEYVVILDSKATIKDRIWTLGIVLKQFDTDQIYIRPVLRDILEKIPEQRRLAVSGTRGLKI